MPEDRLVLLFENDQPVLASLQFSLTLQGFTPKDGSSGDANVPAACCLVVDQRYEADGLGFLEGLRASGAGAPAILLATNPTQQLRSRAALRGVTIVEKPLLGDELADALRAVLNSSKAA
jgi:FixJ family two-component response regulator